MYIHSTIQSSSFEAFLPLKKQQDEGETPSSDMKKMKKLALVTLWTASMILSFRFGHYIGSTSPDVSFMGGSHYPAQEQYNFFWSDYYQKYGGFRM